jgi:hypothetical protein
MFTKNKKWRSTSWLTMFNSLFSFPTLLLFSPFRLVRSNTWVQWKHLTPERSIDLCKQTFLKLLLLLVPKVTTRSLYPEYIANLKLPIDAFYRESRSGVNIAKRNITTGLFGLRCAGRFAVPSPHVAHIVLLITTDYMTSNHQFHIIKYCLYTRKRYALFKPVSEAFIVQCNPVCIIIHVFTFCNISKCSEHRRPITAFFRNTSYIAFFKQYWVTPLLIYIPWLTARMI